jgi:hypothetical protein
VQSALLLVSGMAYNVLKPLLLGRGVDVPMPVILVGALGGMATGGIIGMFVGGDPACARLADFRGLGTREPRRRHRAWKLINLPCIVSIAAKVPRFAAVQER